MGVDHVVAAAPDQPDQARQRGQVAVAGHPQVVHPDAVGGEPGGDRTRVGERDDLAGHRQVAEQQPQLLLGAADPETGDDVQDAHALTPPLPGGGATGAAGA
ncbi:hypothetical protein B0E37_06174 [Streptomyces sp. MH192]|nr:hypothetical protein [Streptomyces sp. MH192]MCF0103554.1 hypothetical protein [Streptomyces sp. MH191]